MSVLGEFFSALFEGVLEFLADSFLRRMLFWRRRRPRAPRRGSGRRRIALIEENTEQLAYTRGSVGEGKQLGKNAKD